MKAIILCFVPLFVAVDVIGILPMFLNLTEGIATVRRRQIIIQSVLTAAAVAILFVLVGPSIFRLLNISVADFMVTGGMLLFIIALRDMLSAEKSQRYGDLATLGAVPIGVPLITGPAVLTTSLLLYNQHGAFPTFTALITNIFFAGVIFWFADTITRILGNAGTKTMSKIASILMASIAVMMIRKGIIAIIAQAVIK